MAMPRESVRMISKRSSFSSTRYSVPPSALVIFLAATRIASSSRLMLVLVLADSLPLMFVGWEGVGACSYLLIGFWFEDPAKAAAGKKAFVVNRIGDFGVLVAMFLIFWTLQG